MSRDRRHFELSRWAAQGTQLVRRTGMHGIRFERDGIWIDDGDGALWAYTPDLFGSTLWAEFGVRYEQEEIELLASRLPPDGVMVDVGANIGAHSLKLARLVPDLRVLAFEPVAETFRTLQRNLIKNGLSARVEPRRLALSDRNGVVSITTRFQAGNFVVPADAPAAERSVEKVECRPLDDIINDLTDRVDAIKCDVEGAELSVLRGAVSTLSRFGPPLLIEIDPRWSRRYGHEATDVIAFLEGQGYGYEVVVAGTLRPASASSSQDLADGRNFLFTKR